MAVQTVFFLQIVIQAVLQTFHIKFGDIQTVLLCVVHSMVVWTSVVHSIVVWTAVVYSIGVCTVVSSGAVLQTVAI